MTTKEYLNQIERYDRMIENKLAEICQLESIATSITVMPKEMNVQSFGAKDKMGDAVCRIVDLESDIDRIVNDMIAKKKVIVSQIDGITDMNVYDLLSKRYISNKTWYDIAEEMGYSVRQVLRLHEKSLKLFEKMYGKSYKN